MIGVEDRFSMDGLLPKTQMELMGFKNSDRKVVRHDFLTSFGRFFRGCYTSCLKSHTFDRDQP